MKQIAKCTHGLWLKFVNAVGIIWEVLPQVLLALGVFSSEFLARPPWPEKLHLGVKSMSNWLPEFFRKFLKVHRGSISVRKAHVSWSLVSNLFTEYTFYAGGPMLWAIWSSWIATFLLLLISVLAGFQRSLIIGPFTFTSAVQWITKEGTAEQRGMVSWMPLHSPH